jgi:hypothetical protein
MVKNRTTTSLLALVALLLGGCTTVTPWPADSAAKPTAEAMELERYGTAQAHESAAEQAELELQRQREAAQRQYAMMTAEAQGTNEAHQRALEQKNQWATQQAANATQVADATAQAVAVAATRDAASANATATVRSYNATATRQAAVEAQDATATERAASATATAAARSSNATVTAMVAAVRSTATAGEREERATGTAVAVLAERERMELQRERWLQPVRTIGPILLVAAIIGAVGWLVWRLATVLEDRARVIRRGADEGEPIILVTRERMAMPMRQFQPLLIAEPGNEHAPDTAPHPYQEGTTARQQAANLEAARHAHQHGERTLIARAPEGQPPRLRQGFEPGLLGVTEALRLEEATDAGILPRQLADAIDAQWREVNGD